MDYCFDTSAINRLLDDEYREQIIKSLLATARVIVTGLNVIECAATRNPSRRTELLQLLRRLTDRWVPLHVPNELLQVRTIAYARNENDVTLSLGDQQSGIIGVLHAPEFVDEPERQEVLDWQKSLETPFREAHEAARRALEIEFGRKALASLSASKFLRHHCRNPIGVYKDYVAAIYERATGTCLKDSDIEDFFTSVPEWGLYLAGWAYAAYSRAFRNENFGHQSNPGTVDLQCAIYVPHCDAFVTNDANQHKALRLLNVLNPRNSSVLRYDQFRREFQKDPVLPRNT